MKKQFRSISIILLILLWTGLSGPAQIYGQLQKPRYSEAIEAFEKFVKEQMALDKAPGISAGFMKQDFIWAKGFGYSDLENMVPAKAESSYRLASNREGLNLVPYIRRLAELVLDDDLDSITYVQDKEGQVIHDACFQAFSYGMSSFDWNGGTIAKRKQDLAQAFSYFNQYANKKALVINPSIKEPKKNSKNFKKKSKNKIATLKERE